MRKLILVAAGIVVLAIAGSLFFLYSNIDSVVATAIETIGSKAAGVPVHVGAVKLSVSSGAATISGLEVGNPPGFAVPNAISIGEINLAIDTASIAKNPIVIKSISVVAPAITYELGPQGSNLDIIEKNVKSARPAADDGKAAANSSAGAARKLVIDEIVVKDGKVALATPLPGGKVSDDLPEIRLTNIGRANGGATSAEVAAQVLNAVLKSVQKTVSADALGGAAGGGVDALRGLLGK
jgi:uncharacterized protein involved in outer membrane biogenesis